MSYDQGRSGAEAGENESEASRPAPGKSNLTQEIAGRGVAGRGGRLPFLDVIQQSFGAEHELGEVEAHEDGEAREAAGEIGASAYAMGNHVAFAEEPDLHTAAHEAAHVVQQRAGVHLKGGVGEDGDPYERHADAVADRVVRGESAADLLSGFGGGGGGGVQLKESDAHLLGEKVKAKVNLAGLIDPVFLSTRTRLGGDLASELKKTMSAELATEAKAAAEAAIDGDGGDAKHKADARAQAASIAEGEVASLIEAKGNEVAEEKVNGLKAQIDAAALAAIDGAQPGRFFDTKFEELRGKAKTAATKKAGENATQRLTDGKAAMSTPAFKAAIKQAVRANVNDPALQEVQDRAGGDADVATTIKTPVETAVGVVHGAVQTYLEEQIGAKGTKLFGHAKANEFRKKMKDAARGQAYADVTAASDPANNALDAGPQARLAGAGTATKQYFTMQGKAQAYDDAKVTVNSFLTELAHNGANEVIKEKGVTGHITEAARTAAWGGLRDGGPAGKKAGLKAATAAANAAAIEQKAAVAPAMKLWQEKLIAEEEVKTVSDTGQEGVVSDAEDDVKQRVTADQVGATSLQHAIEAETVGDGVTKLGTLLDLAVPNSGEALKLACELKIPVPSAPGVFCVVKIEGSAERHAGNKGKDLELGVNLEFGAGFEGFGLSGDARIALFLKARGPDTDKACKMMSYGVYRDLCSNPMVPAALATWWATGKAARTGEVSSVEEAETWAAMVEEYAMTGAGGDDAYAEAGEAISAQGKANAGLVGGEAKLSLATMRHWDKKSLAKAGFTPGQLSHAGDLDARKAAAQDKRTKVSPGQRRNQFNFEGKIEAEANGQKFALGVKLQRVGGPADDARLRMTDVELLGQIPYDPSSPSASTELSKFAAQYVPSALSALRSLYERIKNNDDKDTDTKSVGTAVEDGAELMQGLDAGGLIGNLGKQLTDVKIEGSKSEYMNETLAGALGTKPEVPAVDPNLPVQPPTKELVSQHGMKSIAQVSIYRKDGNWGLALAEIKQLSIGIGERAGVGLSASLTAEKTKKIVQVGQDGVNQF